MHVVIYTGPERRPTIVPQYDPRSVQTIGVPVVRVSYGEGKK